MEEFLKFIITPLLSEPKKLQITATTTSVTIKVGDNDVGRVIGKQGNVINAIRTLSRTYCAIHQLPPTNILLLTPPAPPPVTTKN
jgi:predicted RNA-binding protein YlqC (UPF0109 family)